MAQTKKAPEIKESLENKEPVHSTGECAKVMLPVKDALDIMHGKWKLPIIAALLFGNKRFKQMAKEIPGITDRMLSKELKDLEMNQLVKRTVYDSFPPTVEYSITEHGKTLQTVILALRDWGQEHRQKIIGRS